MLQSTIKNAFYEGYPGTPHGKSSYARLPVRWNILLNKGNTIPDKPFHGASLRAREQAISRLAEITAVRVSIDRFYRIRPYGPEPCRNGLSKRKYLAVAKQTVLPKKAIHLLTYNDRTPER